MLARSANAGLMSVGRDVSSCHSDTEDEPRQRELHANRRRRLYTRRPGWLMWVTSGGLVARQMMGPKAGTASDWQAHLCGTVVSWLSPRKRRIRDNYLHTNNDNWNCNRTETEVNRTSTSESAKKWFFNHIRQ